MSRSATVAVAYLMWKRKTSFTEALDVVRLSKKDAKGINCIVFRLYKTLWCFSYGLLVRRVTLIPDLLLSCYGLGSC